MQIRLLFSVCSLLLFSLNSQASTLLDSIGTENLNGKQIIVHKIEPRESYYSISRKYNVSPQSVIEFNKNKSLQIGKEIKVPTERAYQSEKSNSSNPSNSKPKNGSKAAQVDYKVGPRETLYAISRKFNTTVDDIKEMNNLRSNTLAAGQILKIRYGTETAQITPAMPVVLNIPRNMPNGRQGDT
ncbi:MAG: LysM peptidoglycan-binding domain-containing protein, partial [Pyrinomonadaceae bacterium]|nr:LysM peptidoglycan-binding domain-containing protein [Sphingobacteriaceae bacterium]